MIYPEVRISRYTGLAPVQPLNITHLHLIYKVLTGAVLLVVRFVIFVSIPCSRE